MTAERWWPGRRVERKEAMAGSSWSCESPAKSEAWLSSCCCTMAAGSTYSGYDGCWRRVTSEWTREVKVEDSWAWDGGGRKVRAGEGTGSGLLLAVRAGESAGWTPLAAGGSAAAGGASLIVRSNGVGEVNVTGSVCG